MVESDRNYDCDLCMNINTSPLKITCGHTFCIDCLERIVFLGEESWKCPMDRIKFNPLKDLSINTSLLTETYNKLTVKFKEEALKKLEFRSKNPFYKNVISVLYGNEHSKYESEDSSGNKHKWKAFVRLSKFDKKEPLYLKFQEIRSQMNIEKLVNYVETKNENEKVEDEDEDNDLNKYIETVRFDLHETFRPPFIILTKPPFEVQRIGWGTFRILATVTFKKEYKVEKPIEVEIDLSFSRDLTQKTRFAFLNSLG